MRYRAIYGERVLEADGVPIDILGRLWLSRVDGVDLPTLRASLEQAERAAEQHAGTPRLEWERVA